MGETEDKRREARETDQDAYDRQQSELQAARDERDERLGIGSFTEQGPKSESPVGGNLPAEIGTDAMNEKNFADAQKDDETADDE